MKKIGMGLVGPGFVAERHIDAVRRLGDADVGAIAGSSQQSATFENGYRSTCLVETMLRSHAAGGRWEQVQQ
jgi:hypothetical protein